MFNVLLEDIDPILNVSSHVFWKILISYSRCSRFDLTDRRDLSAPVFSIISTENVFQNFEISTNDMLLKSFRIFLNYVRYLTVSEDKNHWFWGPWTRPKIYKS